ncbi:RDD family protein [Catellatospora sp. NPDC049609]|uniref:RDD family protein n=1 Tax=Catellatospora sp. NPDC049609 TaxID=3155505 RepID=UPI003441263C
MTRLRDDAVTTPAAGLAPTRLESAKSEAEHVLGRRAVQRLAAFDDGTLYVRAGEVRRFLAWLIDFVVYLLGVGVGVVVVSLVRVTSGLSDGAVTVLALSLLFVVPMLYGLIYGNGRALGAVLTGTQLVRVKDGGRVGAKACWAMLIRTLLMPLLLIAVIVGALGNTGGEAPAGSPARVSIDRGATRRLQASGIR